MMKGLAKLFMNKIDQGDANENLEFNLFDSLYKLYLNGNNCDLTLISEDSKHFSVHSCVILATMPKLRKALTEPCKLLFWKSVNVRRLPRVKSRELEVALQYAYLKRCDLDKDDLPQSIELLKTAWYLQMADLKVHCLNFLASNMDMQTAIFLLETKDNRNQEPLREARMLAMGFMLRHLTDQDSACGTMSPSTLKALVRDDRLYVSREEQAWEIVVRWVDHNKQARISLVPELLETLRIGFMHPEFVTDQLQQHPLVLENRTAVRTLKNLCDSVRSTTRLNPPATLPLALRPRLPHTVVLASGGYVVYEPETPLHSSVSASMDAYDHQAECWVRVEGLPLPDSVRVYHGLEVLGRSIYLVGGFGGSTACWRFDLDDLKWHRVNRLQNARHFVATTVLNGRLYALGGMNKSRRLESMEVYDPSKGLWSVMAPMTECRSDAGVAVLDGQLYIVGGFNGLFQTRSVECYDPATNKWKYAAPLICARSGLRCTASRGHIFALGGTDGQMCLSSVERYDPKSNAWSLMKPMRTARANFGLAILDDKIIICGGQNLGQPVLETEIYLIFEDRWYSVGPLSGNRIGVACCTVDDLRFSTWALRSITDRQDAKLLRDPDAKRARYNSDDYPPLPIASGRLDPPNLNPLPNPWYDVFMSEQGQAPRSEEMEQEIEQLVVSTTPNNNNLEV